MLHLEHKEFYQLEAPRGATFSIKDAKLYVSIVTLSTGDDNKFIRVIKNRI